MLMSPIIPNVAGPVEPSATEGSLTQILRAVRTHLGMEVGFISQFHEGRRVFRHVESADGKRCVEVGSSDPLDQSYCHWIVEGKLPGLIRDPRDHPFTAEFAATDALPVGAHLSVPIKLRDGKIYGTFCCFSSAVDQSLTERDMAIMEAFAEVAADLIQSSIDAASVRQTKLRKVKEVLRSRSLDMMYQPGICLDTLRVEFVEALARFRGKPYKTPDKWFATANEIGLGLDLELLAVRTALQGLRNLPPQTTLSINVSPLAAASEDTITLLCQAPLDRIILEITEHETVTNYPLLLSALTPLRSRGLRIAVDDAGAGHSSFRHILKIKPDLIKLDMSLVQGIHIDPDRRALASALIAFAREIGAQLVAEGVEKEEELETLRNLGVGFAQGHLVSWPLQMTECRALLAAQSGLCRPSYL